MRLTFSALGVAGLVLAFVSLSMNWLVIEAFDMTWEYKLTEYDSALGQTWDIETFAHGTALYLTAIGLAVAMYSLLGGFINLAGACAFALGGVLGESTNSFGDYGPMGTVSPGMGFYVALVAALMIIVAIKFPVEVGFGKGGPRPKFRTWHLSRK